jgi:hypothetical protein
MALSILDGNQSATTLSTIVTSGQHIPAHTVVSLGTQAISNITSAVSGTSVTFGLVGGTVTANNFTLTNVLQYDGSHYFLKVGGVATTGGTSFPVYVAGSVTANPTGTQAIAGTVTANVSNINLDGDGNLFVALQQGTNPYTQPISGSVTIGSALPTGTNRIGVVTIGGGTVTIGAGTAQIGSVTVGNSVTIGSLPAISGTVAVGNSITIGQITSLQGQNLLGSSGVFSTLKIRDTGGNYGEPQGNATNTFNLPVYGTVTVGNSVTIGSLPAISGTVTANTFALQGTAVTTSDFTSTTASTVLANYNATREVLTIFNEGAGNLHICAGATCTTIAYQVRLSAGDYYEVPNHQTTITHSAVFATAGTARVTQVS